MLDDVVEGANFAAVIAIELAVAGRGVAVVDDVVEESNVAAVIAIEIGFPCRGCRGRGAREAIKMGHHMLVSMCASPPSWLWSSLL